MTLEQRVAALEGELRALKGVRLVKDVLAPGWDLANTFHESCFSAAVSGNAPSRFRAVLNDNMTGTNAFREAHKGIQALGNLIGLPQGNAGWEMPGPGWVPREP
jgi:hypothetical protein